MSLIQTAETIPASIEENADHQEFMGFGPHLMMDCRHVSKEKTSNLAFVFDFLNRLPDMVGMTKITQPYVFPYSGLVPEDRGITGTVIIAESHLTFHSFVEKDYFFFDIFSCKPFDVDRVASLVIETFEVKDVEQHRAMRGRHFPHTNPNGGSAHKEATALNNGAGNGSGLTIARLDTPTDATASNGHRSAAVR
jgi:S-adenosylmethionine decarboxylase